jgi:hypothetical protein
MRILSSHQNLQAFAKELLNSEIEISNKTISAPEEIGTQTTWKF